MQPLIIITLSLANAYILAFVALKKAPVEPRARVCVCVRVKLGGVSVCGYAASDVVGSHSLKRKPYDSKQLSLPADINTTWALALNVRVMSASAVATRIQLPACHVAFKMRGVSSG